MSWLSKGLKSAGKGLKKVGKQAGKAWEKIDDYALPALGFALGGPVGAALGSAAARGIGDGKFNPKATAIAGLKGYAGGQLAQGVGLVGGKGVGGLLGSGRGLVTGGASPSMASSGGGALKSVAAKSGGWGGTARNVLGGIGNFAKDNPELILGAASALQGSRQQAKADALSKRALELAEQPWNETAGLRRQGLEGMMHPELPDLSAIFANTYQPIPEFRSSNPFSRPPSSGFGRFSR